MLKNSIIDPFTLTEHQEHRKRRSRYLRCTDQHATHPELGKTQGCVSMCPKEGISKRRGQRLPPRNDAAICTWNRGMKQQTLRTGKSHNETTPGISE
ncbi:hypothetical protein VTN49DRAFT_5872 [Thermomyces lanuginosus]|uniref:uncharacterized protein n=1 Tax=Thermomyces lanuginosus TaxID=5541 RepID=UPI00374216F3